MAKTEDDGIIARRTRSKLSLNDTPLDVIEASFVAPDITPDLYNEATLFGDDEEWQTFLAKLMKSEGALPFPFSYWLILYEWLNLQVHVLVVDCNKVRSLPYLLLLFYFMSGFIGLMSVCLSAPDRKWR